MSGVTSIKPYFTGKLSGLGYEEWTDGFGEDNLPSTVIDKSFHQRLLGAAADGLTQESFSMILRWQLKVYFKGFRDPQQAIDESLAASQEIVVNCINLADYKAAGIVGLFFEGFSIDPLDEVQNDNIVIATINFEVLVYNCIAS